LLEEGLTLARQAGAREQEAAGLAALGRLARAAGEPAAARARFRESLAVAGPLARKPVVVRALEGLAGVAAAQGRPAVAARLFGAAEGLRAGMEQVRPPAERDQVARDVAAARAQSDAPAFATAWAAGRVLRLEQAVADALQDAPPVPPAPAARAPAAGAGAGHGRPASAAGPGGRPVRARRATTGQTAGTRAPRRRGRPGDLTDRQVEVLRLVAAGKTNRQIAADLGLSEHTVARHLANVYAKRGLASRAAAAAFALRAGLV
jgi:DNA-binding CsgD family transcriptional regulator